MKKSFGTPVLINAEGRGEGPALERIYLGAGTYNEDWLQALIFDRPDLLPILEIEPGFSDVMAVAREIPCAHGFIDNLYITPRGDIVLVEAKLWRNVQARREVVAQAMDYVAALMAMGVTDLEAALQRSDRGTHASSKLYDTVRDHPEALDEARFYDAVANNLARGRMLVLIVGDGIRNEAEALARLLQGHAGAHFTVGLIELAIWRNSTTGEMIVLPNTLAQTVMIERGIVIVKDGVTRVEAVPVDQPQRAHTISDTLFYEELAKKEPALPQALRAFLDRIEPLGVYPDLKAALSFKVDLADAPKPISLGYVEKSGKFWTNPVAGTVPHDIARAYNQALADLIGGQVAERNEMYLTINGKSAPMLSQLLTQAEGWEQAIRRLTASAEQHWRERR